MVREICDANGLEDGDKIYAGTNHCTSLTEDGILLETMVSGERKKRGNTAFEEKQRR